MAQTVMTARQKRVLDSFVSYADWRRIPSAKELEVVYELFPHLDAETQAAVLIRCFALVVYPLDREARYYVRRIINSNEAYIDALRIVAREAVVDGWVFTLMYEVDDMTHKVYRKIFKEMGYED